MNTLTLGTVQSATTKHWLPRALPQILIFAAALLAGTAGINSAQASGGRGYYNGDHYGYSKGHHRKHYRHHKYRHHGYRKHAYGRHKGHHRGHHKGHYYKGSRHSYRHGYRGHRRHYGRHHRSHHYGHRDYRGRHHYRHHDAAYVIGALYPLIATTLYYD